MALDTYDNLKLEVIDWSHRGDVDLKIDTFIDMAETEMYNNRFQNLKVRGQEKTVTGNLSTTVPTLALPTDYINQRRFRITIGDDSRRVDYEAPESMHLRDGFGVPCFFTVTSQIEFDIIAEDDYAYELKYIGKPTALSSSNQTNEVLTDNPNIYLFGTLWALFQWAEDEATSNRYYTQFINAIIGANKNYDSGRYGPAPVMKVDRFTP